MGAVWEQLVPPSQAGRPGRRVVHAAGTTVRFADGVEAHCATSGLWNVNFGYGNPTIAERVGPVLTGLHYASLFRYSHDLAEEAAAGLLAATGGRWARVLFSTSGSAANDAVMKLARHWSLLGDEPRRRLVVGLRDSYHGMTYGSFALTGEALGQEGYGVDRRLIRHVAADDGTELRALTDGAGPSVAAVVLEPVAGTGARELDPHLLDAAFALRRRHGTLIVADEVATGFFRTGPLLASDRWAERPDIVVLSKGLTNGLAAAATILVGDRVVQRFDAADATFVHGETQAGSPVAAAAILGTLELAADDDLEARSNALATTLDARLSELLARRPSLRARGRGLFRYLGPVADVPSAIEAIRLAGAVVHPGPGGIQLVPQVVTDHDDIDRILTAVESGLRALPEVVAT
jgi:adenosylmethionine-8-amino-7-oxononanoate aminotransferase